jgi:hypothetical protein
MRGVEIFTRGIDPRFGIVCLNWIRRRYENRTSSQPSSPETTTIMPNSL